VASHTFDHKQLTALSGDDVCSELTTRLHEPSITHPARAPRLFRPPYGSFTDKTWLPDPWLRFRVIHLEIDSEDWRFAWSGQDRLECRLNNAYPGAIVLMHDGWGAIVTRTSRRSPASSRRYRARATPSWTLDELMAADDSIPDDIATGNATMPAGCVWPTELA